MKNHRAGHVESTHLHSFAFDEQYNTFHSYGFAAAPTGQGTVGASKEAAASAAAAGAGAGEETVYGNAAKRRKTTAERKEAAERKAALAEEAQRRPADAPYELLTRQPWAEKESQVRGCGVGGYGLGLWWVCCREGVFDQRSPAVDWRQHL